MGRDLNRQAKTFLIRLGTPWLLAIFTAILISAIVGLRWNGVIRTYVE
jgi:hypothetical protein